MLMTNNTIAFQEYNSSGTHARRWNESLFFQTLQQERRRRFATLKQEANQRKVCRALQQTILQLLIHANRTPVDLDLIAEHIGMSRQRTLLFLLEKDDDLWTAVNGNRRLWMTSLRELPDRLFY